MENFSVTKILTHPFNPEQIYNQQTLFGQGWWVTPHLFLTSSQLMENVSWENFTQSWYFPSLKLILLESKSPHEPFTPTFLTDYFIPTSWCIQEKVWINHQSISVQNNGFYLTVQGNFQLGQLVFNQFKQLAGIIVDFAHDQWYIVRIETWKNLLSYIPLKHLNTINQLYHTHYTYIKHPFYPIIYPFNWSGNLYALEVTWNFAWSKFQTNQMEEFKTLYTIKNQQVFPIWSQVPLSINEFLHFIYPLHSVKINQQFVQLNTTPILPQFLPPWHPRPLKKIQQQILALACQKHVDIFARPFIADQWILSWDAQPNEKLGQVVQFNQSITPINHQPLKTSDDDDESN